LCERLRACEHGYYARALLVTPPSSGQDRPAANVSRVSQFRFALALEFHRTRSGRKPFKRLLAHLALRYAARRSRDRLQGRPAPWRDFQRDMRWRGAFAFCMNAIGNKDPRRLLQAWRH
jgi:hypothetical protein